jgi:transcriptional regulator with XRE-family HTH domain
MASQKLEHYLRACRRRAGLSQSEVAYLLGSKTRAQVSRYELRQNAPPLRAALAFQALFGTSVSEMFPGVYESVQKELKRRAGELALGLQTQNGKRNHRIAAQKLQWLVDHSASQHLTVAALHEKSRKADSRY